VLRNEPIHLILARHGNTFEVGQPPLQVGVRTDLSLTAQGRIQAEQLAKFLTKTPLAALYAGTLKRQIETAQIITGSKETPTYLDESALTEIDYGLWEGLTSEEISRRWPAEYNAWTSESKWAHGIFGRTLEDHMHDIEIWLDALRKKYNPGDTVVAVTSNGIIRLFYSFEEKWKTLQESKQMEQLKVKTGHFCELLLFPDSLKVKNWNQEPKN
jgi:broad specificity phosphatase PhoE